MSESKLRSKSTVEKWYKNNDGTRSLMESILVPEVGVALRQFNTNCFFKPVLIGGIAVSYHAKPRATIDVELLFPSSMEMPYEVAGFARIGLSKYEHQETGVRILTYAPHNIGMRQEQADQVREWSHAIYGHSAHRFLVASKAGLTAVLLSQLRLSQNDRGDIAQLISTGRIDLSPYSLTQQQLDVYQQIVQNEQD